MRYKDYKYATEFVLFWPTTPHGLPWSVVNIPSENPFDRTDFSFASGYQLEKLLD